MANQSTKNITLPGSTVERKGGVVILPLRKWERIEQDLEDLEMYRSENLAKEIDKRRKEKETVPIEKVLKKYHI